MNYELQITDEARHYALEELCRRAGLNELDWRRWRMENEPDGTLILRHTFGSGKVIFRRQMGELNNRLFVRKSWLSAPTPTGTKDLRFSGSLDDFIVPFCTPDSKAGQPLFLETGPKTFTCTEDLLASAVLVLSRYEETGAAERDEHGRFRALASAAALDGYLDRPIVDEWGLALEQVIAALEPGFTAQRRVRVKISHDVDLIGIPFGLYEPMVQLIARRDMQAAFRDLLSGFTKVQPGSLLHVIRICEEGLRRGLNPALYWKASERSRYDSGYSIADARVTRVMHWAKSHGVEIGIHPGYETLNAPDKLAQEVQRWQEVLGEEEIGGRQHYLRWRPETWQHWEQCGLAYDSSVGYPDCAGFRAGTCWPYYPWLLEENRRARLLEIPLIAMDRTLVSPRYMGLSAEESVALVQDLLHKCARVGGVFTLLWHNNCLGQPFSAYYPGIFDALAGLENYDWREEAARPESHLLFNVACTP